jgi:membrane-associated protease RseP (regulator of RpoE activity)
VDDKKEDAIRAFQDAGFGYLIEAARNEQNVEYVRARAGQTGGGGGGLFRGLATMAAGRALGGTQGAILETMAKRSLSSDGGGDDQAASGGPLPLPTGRAELGAQLDLTRLPQGGLRIAAVAVDGPAQAAGLMAGDVITRIAGVPVNSRGSFYVATKNAVDLDTFEIVYRRDGTEQTLQFDPAARVVTASDDAQAIAHEATPSGQAAASDTEAKLAELERLGDLRDRGILSEEEFEAMKAKILQGS